MKLSDNTMDARYMISEITIHDRKTGREIVTGGFETDLIGVVISELLKTIELAKETRNQ